MHTRKPRTDNGFTLVELLVVISIIALLLSIMMPALGRAREQARMLVDGSNLKQLGMAWRFYANDNRDTFPMGLFWTTDYWWLPGTGIADYLPTKLRNGGSGIPSVKGVWPGWYCTKNAKTAIKIKELYPNATWGAGSSYSFNFNIGFERWTKVSAVPNSASVPHLFCFWDSNPLKTNGVPNYFGNYFCMAGDPEIPESNYRAFRFMAGVPDVHGKGLGTNFMFVDTHLERVTPMNTQLKYAHKFKWEIPASAYKVKVRSSW